MLSSYHMQEFHNVDSEKDTLAVMRKYNASYLYVGRAEMRNADAEVSKFERCKDLKEVYKDEYESGGIYIFALRHAPSSRR